MTDRWVFNEKRYEGHTPGPWGLDPRTGFRVVAAGTDRGICSTGGHQCNYDGGKIDSENRVNAHLIVDAPRLLAECVRLREENQHLTAENEQLRKVIGDGQALLSDKRGWGTYERMEGVALLEERNEWMRDASQALTDTERTSDD